MDRLLRRIGVSENERSLFLWSAGIMTLLCASIEFARIGRDSYFLNTAGAEQIPKAYIAVSLLMIAASLVYARRASGAQHRALLLTLHGGVAVVGAGLWLTIQLFGPTETHPAALPYVVFCCVEPCILLLLMQYWAYVNGLFDAWQGKRLFPLLGGSGLFGSLLGGLGANGFATLVGASHLFLGWVALLLLAAVLVFRHRPASGPEPEPAETDEPEPQESRSVLRRIWSQPLMRTLCFMAVPIWLIAYTIEFNYFSTMARVYTDPNELASFLGMLIAGAALVGLVLQFTVTPRLLERFGVGAVGIIYPISLTTGCCALLTFSMFPVAAGSAQLPLMGIALLVVFARLSDVAVYLSIHDSVQQLLFYAVNRSIRDASRTFLSGTAIPLSMAMAGLTLLVLARIDEPIYSAAFVAVALAFLLVVVALNITPEYLMALLSNVEPAHGERRAEILSEIGKLEDSDARYVLLQSVTSADLDEARFAVDHLFGIRDEELLYDIEEVIDEARPETRAFICDRLDPEDLAAHPDLAQTERSALWSTISLGASHDHEAPKASDSESR